MLLTSLIGATPCGTHVEVITTFMELFFYEVESVDMALMEIIIGFTWDNFY